MDVRCGRCGTEYEFDDALISERGTTVKCTNCGYQFKVFPDAAAAAPERWVVRTVAGRELVYTTLKDLQRGIAKGHVSADDMLSRGNRPARPLSAIPELEPFLKPNGASMAPKRAPRTLQGVAPAANAASGGDAPPSRMSSEHPASLAPAVVRPQSLTPEWGALQATRPEARLASRPTPVSDSPSAAPSSAAPSTPRSAAPGSAAPSSAAPSTRSAAPGSAAPSSAAPSTRSALPSAAAPSAPRSAPPAREGARFPGSASTSTIPGGVSLTAPTVRRTPPGGTGLLHDLPRPTTPQSARPEPAPRFDVAEPPTIPRFFPGPDLVAPAPPDELKDRPVPEPAKIPRESRQPAEPPRAPLTETESRDPVAATAEDPVARGLEEARALLQHDDQTDPYYVQTLTRRNARSRWLVLVVVLGAGALLAGTVGKRYLAKYTKGTEVAASQTDATITPLIAEGERLLARGDLEGAKDAFAKASARAENDRQVLTAQATLEVVRADLLWLKQRVLEARGEATSEQTRRELAQQIVRVRGAVERTKLVAPEAASTARLLVHAKRLDNKVAEARRHVAALSQDASLPENAYALAALDMADQAPVWSSIVHRLRIAAGAEGPLGLARAALVYAMARSNETDAAKAELEKLGKANPSHPLVFDLRALVEKNSLTADAEAGDVPSEDGAAPDQPGAGDSSPGVAADGVGGDFRSQLKQAYTAVEQGQLAKAERLYNAVLAKQPGNTEALSGLADIAHRRNDSGKAARLYEEVLRKNPSYLPALMANADQKWASGDRAGAVGLYRRILEQAGADSSYGRRSAQRIAQAEAEANAKRDESAVTPPDAPHDSAPDTTPEETAPAPETPPAPEPAPTTPDEPAPSREPEGSEAPHIDTTDLPELNQ